MRCTGLPWHRENDFEWSFSRQGKHRESGRNIKNTFLAKLSLSALLMQLEWEL